MLVHYHAYGDAGKVTKLVKQHSGRIRKQIDAREEDEVGRLMAEYQVHTDKFAKIETELADAHKQSAEAQTKTAQSRAEATLAKLEKQREKVAAKLTEREERIAESCRRADDDRQDVVKVGDELIALYANLDELLRHARVVNLAEIEENEFNLNVPRYVDTIEPEPRFDVKDALQTLQVAQAAAKDTETTLRKILKAVGYDAIP